MKNKNIWLMVLPLYLFTVFLVMGPMVYGLLLSFWSRGAGMQIDYKFTLENYKRIWEYKDTIGLSLKVAVTTTLITTLVGYPFGYFMSRLNTKLKNGMVFLVILPFWTNSLLRLSGITIILKADGILEKLLKALGLIDESLGLMFNYGTVILGMVYMLLPMMILSVYNAMEKMDWELVLAAYDLGAGKLKAFMTITFKLTIKGLVSGVILTFIPSMGLFFVAERLGGNKIYLIGNLIKDQITNARHIPFAAALAVGLAFISMIVVVILKTLEKRYEN